MDLRILEIASHTENNKVLENFTHKSKNKNPLCGDEMEISLIVKNDIIKDIGYQCKSCVYCQASVSLLSRKLKNKKIEEIKSFITNGEKLFDDAKVAIEKHWKDFKEILDKKKSSKKRMSAVAIENGFKGFKDLMIKITKPILQKALIAGFFSAFTIGVLTVLTYKSTLGYFLAGSFGSSMVLLFGFPDSPFAQPKNVFFGHLLTAFVGVFFVNYIPLPIYINIALAVGAGVFLMILLSVVHPPAGGNPIMVIIGSASYEYLINPIIFGCIIILLLAILINKYLLKKNYPLK